MKDEVVLAQPAPIGLDHGTGDALKLLAHDGFNTRGEVDIPNPAAGQVHEAFPIAGERKLIKNAGNAVIVVLYFAFEALAAFELECFKRADDGRTLVTDVGGRGVLHAGLLHGARVHGLLQQVEPQFFADIELDEDHHGSAERGICRHGNGRPRTQDGTSIAGSDTSRAERAFIVNKYNKINQKPHRIGYEPNVAARKALSSGRHSPAKNGTNFALFSEGATRVDVCLFDEDGNQTDCVTLRERTAFVWHGFVRDIKPGQLYGYRVDGPWDPEKGHRFNFNKLLVDPYAKAISGTVDWKAPIFPYDLASGDPIKDGHARQRCRRAEVGGDRRAGSTGSGDCRTRHSAARFGDLRSPCQGIQHAQSRRCRRTCAGRMRGLRIPRASSI